MDRLRTFDAFPKTEEQHVRRSSKGGITSILTYLFLLLIAWTEFGSYFGGYIDQQYTVDKDVRETVQINMDLYIKMPCEYIHVNARDKSNDRKFVSEELIFEDMPFFIPYGTRVNGMNDIVTPDLDEILGEAIPAEFRDKLDFTVPLDENKEPLYKLDGCHVYGSIRVNRLPGELQITAKGLGYRDRTRTPIELVDFSHVINEFSFGDFYPYIDNPLDGIAKIEIEDPLSAWVYFTSVVPTLYQKLGAEVDTNQYSVSQYRYSDKDHSIDVSGRVPGIFFKYDFEPLSIVILDKRLSFLQFLVRLVAILSFILYVASWLFRAVDKFLILVLGPKWSLRSSQEGQSMGLLD